MTRFTHAGREWLAELCVNESNTREFIRIRPVERTPRPTAEEYRAAKAIYKEKVR